MQDNYVIFIECSARLLAPNSYCEVRIKASVILKALSTATEWIWTFQGTKLAFVESERNLFVGTSEWYCEPFKVFEHFRHTSYTCLLRLSPKLCDFNCVKQWLIARFAYLWVKSAFIQSKVIFCSQKNLPTIIDSVNHANCILQLVFTSKICWMRINSSH